MWKDDEKLKRDLEGYVKQALHVSLLEFAYSLSQTDRHYFDINYIDYEIELDDLEESVREEMNGPGNLLGYRAMTKKIREILGQKVPRNLVYAMMEHVDPNGLEERGRIVYIHFFAHRFFQIIKLYFIVDVM